MPVAIIRAVREVEGGKRGMAVRNTNGSDDLGPMQINTFWLPTLKQYGISVSDLKNDVCTNLAVGAWILRKEYARFGNWEQAVAAYNAGPSGVSKPVGRAYASKVFTKLRASLQLSPSPSNAQPLEISSNE